MCLLNNSMMRKCFLLVFLPVGFSVIIYEPKKSDYSCFLPLAETVYNLTNMPLTTLVSESPDSLLDIVASLQCTIGSFRISRNHSSKLTIIIFNNEQDVYLTNTQEFWDPICYFVLNFPKFTNGTTRIFEYLWNTFSAFRVILSYNFHERIYTFDPFTNTQEALCLPDLYKSKLFSKKAPVLNGEKIYSVFAGAYRNDVYNELKEIILLRALSEKLKMTHVILNTSDELRYGFKYPNGSYGGVYNDLVRRLGNISANSHFIEYEDLDVSFSHYIRISRLCFAFAKSKKIPPFIAAMKSFNLVLVLSVIFLYGAAGIALRSLKKLSLNFRPEKTVEVNSVLTMYGLCLGLPVNYHPRMLYERFIFSSILLMSFVVVSFFQTTFTTILSTPPTTYDVPKTKEDVNNLRYAIWTSSKRVISQLKEAGYNRVKFHLRTKQEFESKYVPPYDVGILEKFPASLHVKMWEFKNPSNYQITGICDNANYEALVLPRGSPFQLYVDQIISRLQESGIMTKWVMKFYETQFLTNPPLPDRIQAKPIEMKDIEIPLWFLMGSLTIAFIIWILESLIHNFKGRKAKKFIKRACRRTNM